MTSPQGIPRSSTYSNLVLPSSSLGPPPRYSSVLFPGLGSPKPSLVHGVDLFHQPPSLRTSSRGRWAAPLHRSDLPFWQETRALHPARKTGSRRGGEPRVSTESALTAPTWLPRATCLFPGKSQPPHTHTQNPNLLANKIQPVTPGKHASVLSTGALHSTQGHGSLAETSSLSSSFG